MCYPQEVNQIVSTASVCPATVLDATIHRHRVRGHKTIAATRFGDMAPAGMMIVDRTLGGIDCTDFFALRRSDSGERPSTGAVFVPQLLRRTVTELSSALGWASAGVDSTACREMLPTSL